DILALGIVLEHAGLALRVDRLDDVLVDAPLANRPAPVCAPVIPGDELTIDLEDADLRAVTRDHLALAVRKLIDAPDNIGLHPYLLRPAANRSPASRFPCARHNGATRLRRRRNSSRPNGFAGHRFWNCSQGNAGTQMGRMVGPNRRRCSNNTVGRLFGTP